MEKAYKFLKQLSENNNRDWFNSHKKEYQEALAEFTALVEELIREISKFDARINGTTAKECIFRIYRDTRFCKDKPPYKENFGAIIAPGGRKSPYAGYYIHYQPKEAFAGGGLWHPQKEILDAVRTQIHNYPLDFLKIINSPNFKKNFGKIQGRKLKKTPQGFDKNFPYIELLKYKDYTVKKDIDNHKLLSKSLKIEISEIFHSLHEFNEFLNQAIDRLLL